MSENDYTERLSKCYTGVVHDIMRDDGHKNFTLPSSIRPSKNKYILAGQIFTMEGIVDQTLDHHETLLAWTGFLSKAPNNKVVICQPNNHEVALMGELSAETLEVRPGLQLLEPGCLDPFQLFLDLLWGEEVIIPLDNNLPSASFGRGLENKDFIGRNKGCIGN